MKKSIQIQYDENVNETLALAAKAGFQYVALGFGSIKCFHHSDWEQKMLELEKILSDNKLQCIQTHLPYYDPRLSAEITDRDMDTAMLRCIQASSGLGASWCAYHPRSAVNDNFSPRKSMEYAKEAVAPLAEEAQKCNTGIAIENLAVFPDVHTLRFFSSDYEDLCELCDYFNSPNVAICWDFGHANLMDFDQRKAITHMGRRIKATHIHDNFQTHDRHLLPSQGNTHWEIVMPALFATGYDGALTLEINYKYDSSLESFFHHGLCCLEEFTAKYLK